MIVLRDGRHLVGNLRTFDQYSNMVLDEASERRFHSDDDDNNKGSGPGGGGPKTTYFTDVQLGMYIVRGDSVVLLGRVGSEDEETAVAVSDPTTGSAVAMKRLDNDAFEEKVEAFEERADREDDDGGGENASDNGGAESTPLEWDFDKDLLA